MSVPVLGRYHFLPWVRRGVALAARNADPLQGPLPAHLDLDVKLTVQALRGGTVGDSRQVGPTARLHGPGDVLGIDPRHVIRTEPRPFTSSFEANYFAAIEFDHLDFPWLFTPAAPSGDRLRPWLCLLVLKQDEFTEANTAPNPLPSITVTKPVLPDLSEAWAWAHTQVSGDLPGDGLGGLLATAPQRALSRLLCARRLDPNTAYSAFLVPAFEAGRLAGLGLPPGGAATTAAAWQPSAAGVQLPFYYRFEFATADRGDFLSLVRLLTPRVLPDQVGVRPMDVSQPAVGVPSAGPPLGLSGALRSLLTQDTAWTDPGRSAFQGVVVPLLNWTSPVVQDPDGPNLPPDPAVVPPIYGRWHAAVTSVTADGQRWIDQLNTDPRNRAPAGLGTRVVDRDRVPLLAAAWRQVAAIERANQLLRQAQLARAAMLRAFAGHFRPALPETLLTLTAAVHARVQASPRTVLATLAQSRLPVRALSGTFRRVARPLGPVRRRQDAAGLPPGQLLARLNRGDIDPVPPLHPPGGMTSIDDASDRLFPPWAPGWLRRLLPYAFWILVGLAGLLLVVLLLAGLVVLAVVVAVALLVLAVAVRRRTGRWRAAAAIRFERLTATTIGGVAARPGFQAVPVGAPTPPGPGGTGDSPEAARFREAVGAVSQELQAPTPDPPPPPPADLPALHATLLSRLDPNVTVPARMAALVAVAGRLGWSFEDPIEPIMAAPEFPQPMYEPLRDLDQSLLLPGVELIPPDTLGLLVTNHRFIEAYIVGLNHEMARQLLWEDYQTDQRGSYFRQFWDVRSYVPTPADPTDPDQLREKLKDIRPIHTWPLANQLGGNQNRPEIAGDKLVLLLRGELLHRYPNTVIYAAQAQWNGAGQPRVIDDDHHRYPLFRGTLSPDITFVGFDLTAAEARGGQRDAGGPAGWFFVFQEQPTEPRFGLEPELPIGTTVREWNQLSWANFSFPPAAPQSPVYALARVQPTGVNIQRHADNPQDPDNRWGVDSAQTAFITYRRPARVAVHADMMLPPEAT